MYPYSVIGNTVTRMALLAVPNISVGVANGTLSSATTAIVDAGARLLDVHSDETHNRSVLTTTADEAGLVAGMVALAQACTAIDLTTHVGVHPRVGALDVCPFVPYRAAMTEAVEVAHVAGRAIARAVDAPVFFYGKASLRPETEQLPDIRAGGLEGLGTRMAAGLLPDEGPRQLDPRYGAVLVGARGPLVAFNVWLKTDLGTARSIAAKVREPGRVRALGLPMSDGHCQVSMNLISPDEVSIEDAFDRVAAASSDVVATEIVGLVEERFLPSPNAKVTRLLVEPGHSLESALGD